MYSVVGLSFCCLFVCVYGHGRLLEPPSRSSMWRVGFKTPKNYNDNQLNCGGFMNQYLYQRGRCGVCGDPNQGPKDNEAGGRYATGTIAKTYSMGQVIDITLDVTADHKGWFEFRLCPNNNPAKVITHDCLNQNVLPIIGSGTRYTNPGGVGMKRLQVKLPDGLQCTQCVLQWKWHAGNNYGINPDGRGCVGCGSQEEFYGCADIAISSNGQTQAPVIVNPTNPIIIQQSTMRPVVTFRPIVTFRPFVTNAPVKTVRPPALLTCKAINYWAGVESLDQWCTVECRKGNCPKTACTCQ